MSRLSDTMILNMHAGPAMDEIITAAMTEISGEQYSMLPYSTDQSSAFDLWDFVACYADSVGIVRMCDSPKLISVYCGIKNEDPNEEVHLQYDNWIEALARAFLLFYNGHFGDYIHPKYECVMRNAPQQLLN